MTVDRSSSGGAGPAAGSAVLAHAAPFAVPRPGVLIRWAELGIALLALAAGGYIFFSTLRMVLQCWTAVPYGDQWDNLILELDKLYWHTTPLDLPHWVFYQHNEHRIAVPRLIFVVDRFLFAMNNKFAFFCNVAIQVSLAALTICVALRTARRRIAESLWITGAVLALLFSAMQWENFLWGFQVQFFGVTLAAVATFAAVGLGPPSVTRLAAVIGLESVAATFAYGASAMRFLLRARPLHDVSGLLRTMSVAAPILTGLGFGAGRIAAIEADDPDLLAEALRAIPSMPPAPRPASFRPLGGKRSVLRFAMSELHRAAPEPVGVVALPDGAPFGAVEIEAGGCTLCLSCVSACPTGALRDDPERPVLRFVEDACVQCGLCQATCPENVITLRPQIDFDAASAPARILKEEEPFCCIRCGKPFGVKSTIERVVSKLEGKHWMYTGSPRRLDVIRMCDDCRVAFVAQEGFEPYGAQSQIVRTTDDYLRERDQREKAGKNGS